MGNTPFDESKHPRSGKGQFTPTSHSEPENIHLGPLGQPTMRERFDARQEVATAVLEPLSELIARGRPHPQSFLLEANPNGILVGAALDPTGKEIPDSRTTVGKALLEKGIQAEHVLSPSDDGKLVVPCGEATGWFWMKFEDFQAAEEAASDAPQPGTLPPLPIPGRPQKRQLPKRPTPPPGYTPRSTAQRPKRPSTGLPGRPKLPGRPTLPPDQTPPKDNSDSPASKAYFGPDDHEDLDESSWPTRDGDGNHEPWTLPDDEGE